MKRIKLPLVVCLSACLIACTSKPNTDPSATAVFNSISARLNRVASIYAPAVLDTLPLVAATLKWDDAKVESIKRIVQTKIKDSAQSAARTLGKVTDSAISASQKVVIGPLLIAIGDGLAELDALGLFSSIEGTKLEAGVRIAAMALKTIGRLLPRELP